MKKLITFLLTFTLVLSSFVPAFAAASAEPKENANNPEIHLKFTAPSMKNLTYYTFTIESGMPGVLYLDNVPYATNKSYSVKFCNPKVDKTNLKDRFVTGNKVYGLHEIYKYTPGVVPAGMDIAADCGQKMELIYARSATQTDMGSNTTTSKNTTYEKITEEVAKAYTDKYYINSKECTENEYNTYRSSNSYKERITTTFVSTLAPKLLKTMTDPPVVSCSIDNNCVGHIIQNIVVHEYYKETQNYLREHRLEALSQEDKAEYTGSIKINAMNNIGKTVEVTGNIEFSSKTINFSSERFNIKDGSGTFKTNSASAISLSKLLKGQPYKISNVKADGASVKSVTPASGTISENTEVKITLQNTETTGGSSSTPTLVLTGPNLSVNYKTTVGESKAGKPSVVSFEAENGITGNLYAGNTIYDITKTYNANGNLSLDKAYLVGSKTYKLLQVSAVSAGTYINPPDSQVLTWGATYCLLETSGFTPPAGAVKATPINTETYNITWKNYDGKVLKETTVKSGTIPSYDGTPTRAADDHYTYTFSGWSPAVTAATANKTYTAVYKASPNPTIILSGPELTEEFSTTIGERKAGKPKKVSFEIQNGIKGNLYVGNTIYDTTKTYNVSGDLPLDKAYLVADKTYQLMPVSSVSAGTYINPPDDQVLVWSSTYRLLETSGFTPPAGAVKATPIGSETKTYDITWKNYNGKILATTKVKSGATPAYSGKTPAKPSDANYTYTFSGWSPAVTKASKNATYTATFKATAAAKTNSSLPKVSIKAPGKAKTSITAKWSKLSKANQKKVSGIQVQCSTSSKFNKNVKSITAKKTAASKKISKLKKKTTYYVRVRTYKKSGNKTYYGKWSAIKKVKTK